jgi:hypothetical protein
MAFLAQRVYLVCPMIVLWQIARMASNAASWQPSLLQQISGKSAEAMSDNDAHSRDGAKRRAAQRRANRQ